MATMTTDDDQGARADSDRFLEAIAHTWGDEYTIATGPACGRCPNCNQSFGLEGDGPPDQQPADEGGFSREECDSCGSTLSGDRFCAHALKVGEGDAAPVHLAICADCLVYHANGDMPESWR